MQYKNFEVSILPGQTPGHYLIHASSETQGEATARMNLDSHFKEFAILLEGNENQKIDRAQIKAFGSQLYASLFSGEVQQLWERSLGEVLPQPDWGLRLRLRIEAPELAALPWEFLYSPTRDIFLATSHETPLIRYLNLPEPMTPMSITEPISVLVVIPDLWNLDVASEKEVLQKSFARLHKRLTVDYLEGQVTPARMREALRQREYHLVHYIGHGDFAAQSARVYLNDENGSFLPLTDEQFGAFFTDNRSVKLIVLNTCLGGKQSSTRALAGMAPQLVKRGLPAVVAMQYPITDDDAIFFAREFYGELCASTNSGMVDFAISRARNALWQESKQAHAFAIPVLFMRSGDGRLWNLQHEEEKRESTEGDQHVTISTAAKKLVVKAMPSLLLALVLIILASISKEQLAEIEVITKDFAFRSSDSINKLLIKSLPVESLYFTHFDQIYLNAHEIRSLPDGQILHRPDEVSARVTITPQHPNPIFSNVQFEGVGLRLHEIALQPGLLARLSIAEDANIKLDLSNQNQPLSLQLSDTFTIRLEKCKLQISSATKTQAYPVKQQNLYWLTRDRSSLMLTLPPLQAYLQLSLAVPSPYFDNAELLLLEPEIATDSLSFIKDNYNRAEPLSSTTDFSLYLRDMNPTEPYWSRKDMLVYVKAIDLRGFSLKHLKLQTEPLGFRILLSGESNKIEVGTNKDFLQNEMPSILEWLWAQKKIVLIISVLAWLIGTQLAIAGLSKK